MVRITTPDVGAALDAPVLDIKLSQSSLSFFFPASTISGHVIHKNHYGNADYDLNLIFGGYNRIKPKFADDPVETAPLFEYTENVHSARKGKTHMLRNNNVDLAPIPFPFKHRFPSATDHRSFSPPGGSLIDLTFSNHVHDLPPSFDDEFARFECSVEYELRAELFMDNCLVASCTLPVMFIPYTRPVHGVRSSPPIFTTPDPYTDSSLSKICREKLVDIDTVLSVGFELPRDIVVGAPFNFIIYIQMQYTPEYEDDCYDVKVPTLRIASSTSTRTLQQRQRQSTSYSPQLSPNEEQKHVKERILTLHPIPNPSVPYPSFDTTTQRLSYQFQATLSSYYSPSFRSFLVSNTFCFEGPVSVLIDGHAMDLPLAANEVTVLSPAQQPTSTRKFSGMTGAKAATTGMRYGLGTSPHAHGCT